MIKLNFEFDSKDPISARFFDWISAFPLDKSAVKVTTSVDYLDPSSDAAETSVHRVGNIILEFSPDDTKLCDASDNDSVLKPESDVKVQSAASSVVKDPTHDSEPEFDNATDRNSNDFNIDSTDTSGTTDGLTTDSFSDTSVATVSTEVAFESDLDESLLAAVAFADADQPDESFEPEDDSESLSQEKNVSESENASSTAIDQEEKAAEDLDFLLNSLDEFNN